MDEAIVLVEDAPRVLKCPNDGRLLIYALGSRAFLCYRKEQILHPGVPTREDSINCPAGNPRTNSRIHRQPQFSDY